MEQTQTAMMVKLEAPELLAIDKSKAETIRATFAPMAEMLDKFNEVYQEIIVEAATAITEQVAAKARRLRLDIVKVRTATEKVRKEQKEEYLRAGKAIDGVSNILKWAVTDKESKLEEIEKHFENLEKQRIEALQAERVEELYPYFSAAGDCDLSGMADDVWVAYLTAKKKDHADKIEAERKAKEEAEVRAKAEAEERERIRSENERLKKEAEEAAAKAKIEAEARAKEDSERKAKEETERKEREAAAKKEREEYEAKLRAEREKREIERKIAEEAEAKARAEADAKLKAEREATEAKLKAERQKAEAEAKKAADEKAALEKQLKEKEEAEAKAKAEEAARVQAELSKGDADKLKDFAADLVAICKKYAFQAEKNQAFFALAIADLAAIAEKAKALQ